MNRLKRWLAGWIPFWIYSAFVFEGAILPPEKIPHFLTALNDKFLHFTEYFFLFGFAVNAFEKSRLSWLRKATPQAAWGYSLFLGAVTEWAQLWVPGRRCEFWDWVTDAAGASLAWGLWLAMTRKVIL